LNSHALKVQINRLDRLVHIRKTFVDAAENRVRLAEKEVARIEAIAEENARSIQRTMEELAHPVDVTGMTLQRAHNYLQSLRAGAAGIQRSVTAAKTLLEERRREWNESIREEKMVGVIRDRRLQQWVRQDIKTEQKLTDDVSIGRFLRDIRNESDKIIDRAESD